MKLFLTTIILLLSLEGSLFAAFPELMRRSLLELAQCPSSTLRRMGIVCLLIALALGYILANWFK